MFSQGRNSLSSDYMYSNVQRFHVKNSFGEERTRDLRITVDVSSPFGKCSQKMLDVQVLDDDDPFFYYSLHLSEDDYLRLKSSQGLLVDFNSFPAQLIRLLEQCKEHEVQFAKFLIILEEEGRGEFAKTMLKIVETNNFKHLCHLVLQIDHGNDEDVKKIMVNKIKALKERNSKAENTIMSLESQLSSKNSLLEAAELKVAEVENRWKNDKLSFQAQAAKGLSEESDKLRKAQLDWQIKSQREKAEIEEKFHALIREKDAELSKCRIEQQIVADKRSHVEAALSEQSKRVEVLEKELMAARSDLASSRRNLAKVEAESLDKERNLSHVRTKLSSLEHELKEKSMLMSRQEEIMKNLQEHKARLEGTISEKEAYISKKQKTIQNVSEELIKANEIIAKLQKELNSSTNKLKTRTDIALEQEKVIEKHEKTIERLEKELKLKTKKLESLDTSEEGLKTKLNELQETLEAKEKKIKENEKIIDWLNRRCTEQAVQSYSPSYATLNPNTLGVTGNTGNLSSGTGFKSGNIAVASGVVDAGLGRGGAPPPGSVSSVTGTPLVGNAVVTITSPLGNMGSDFKTSTPFERFKESRVPFTTMATPPSRFNIMALDKVETPAIQEEEESENEEPSPSNSPLTNPNATVKTSNPVSSSPKDSQPVTKTTSSDKKKASPVDPPKITSKPTRKSTVASKKPLHPAVPSSYFLS